MKKKILWSLVVVISLLLVGGAGIGYAAVSGVCSECHTMHNSQGGAVMATGTNYEEPGYGSLTRGTCGGCHTTDTADPLEGGYPRVKTSSSSDTNQLAGGYFTNISGQTDNHGNNEHSIDSTVAPAGYDSETNYVGSDWYKGEIEGLQCAGAAGCHGNETDTDPAKAIAGGHHANELKGLTVGYRMLQIDITAVVGSGASDFEKALNASPSTDDSYNYYSATSLADGGSISRLCGKCHGDFHGNEGSGNTGVYDSAWVRHPTDEPLVDEWEIMTNRTANYLPFDWKCNPVGTVGAVDPLSGTPDLYVTCLSCHRAHGSAENDILRFDYDDQIADTTVKYGCLGCHDRQRKKL